MKKRLVHSNLYYEALRQSIEEVQQKSTKAWSLIHGVSACFCVAEDDGDLVFIGSIGTASKADEKTCRDRALLNLYQLREHKGHDLSRELGQAGAIRAVPYLFSLAGFHAEISEVLMFMVAVKTNIMSKEVARDRLHYFPNKYGGKGSESVWEIE